MINRPNKSRIHLVLEYMHCGSVQGVLEAAEGRRLGQAQARKYFGQLVMSLQHCHSRGVVHKDVKPANLMLDRAGDVSSHDIAAIWVAFFSRQQRYRCQQGRRSTASRRR